MRAILSRRHVLFSLLVLSAAAACADDPVSVTTLASLDAPTVSAVRTALQDEYNASAVYVAVMNRFGRITPFVNIERAERQRASSLAALLSSRGLPVPDAAPREAAPSFSSVAAACSTAADAEIANIAMYDAMLATSLPADVRRVFENNRRASLENHLPAFQRCGPALAL
jgi:hypothetical protein